jgi:hypothetical protein
MEAVKLNEIAIGPSEKRDRILANPDRRFDFVLFAESETLSSLQTRLNELPETRASIPIAGDDHFVVLPLISAVASNLSVASVLALLDSGLVTRAWYLHRDLSGEVLRIIQAITRITDTFEPPTPINLSLGPPRRLMPMLFHETDPMNLATRAAAQKGHIVIMAAGNYGDLGAGRGWINPWCVPDWVLSVGASDETAQVMWPGSAHGRPDDPTSGPDFVADGIEVIGPWPTNLTKSKSRREHDESNSKFTSRTTKEKWDLYTLESGTSQATAQVTRSVAQIVHFLTQMMRESEDAKTIRFTLMLPIKRFEHQATYFPRLSGEVLSVSNDTIEVVYTLTTPWQLVRQLLIDTAQEMPEQYGRDWIGAGFISPAITMKQFGQYGEADISIDMSKVR